MVNFVDGSLMLSDSKIKMVFLDSNLNPVNHETKCFCRLYSKDFNKCKKLYIQEGTRYFKSRIGHGIYAIYVVLETPFEINEDLLENIYVKELSKCDSHVSILFAKGLDKLKLFFQDKDLDVNFYSKVI